THCPFFCSNSIEDEILANIFLRKIQEATAAEARQTNKEEVLIELANEVGLDLPSFIARMDNGSAQWALEGNLNKTKVHGIRALPSFLLKWGTSFKIITFEVFTYTILPLDKVPGKGVYTTCTITEEEHNDGHNRRRPAIDI
ncbi:DsbA family protein, partial [Fodinibius halophilus]